MGRTSYDETIGALEAVVDRAAVAGDRIGYFAAMYLAVTRTVRRRAGEGRFEDRERMERFVCRFADRFLDAVAARDDGRPATGSWEVAFATSRRWRPVVLQHLLLGMNAHINLDLGVVAAELGPAAAIEAVQADFDAINDVLGELVDACQNALGEVSPWLGLCDRVGRGGDEAALHFSLVLARRQAWAAAVRLAPLTGEAHERAVADLDCATARLGRRVAHPGWWASLVLLVVRLRERTRPGAVMARLAAVTVD